MSLRASFTDFPLRPEAIFLTKFVLRTPISQGYFTDHLEQGPPFAPSLACASCDTNTLRKPLVTTPQLLLPNIQLRPQLSHELAEGSRQLSSSGDKPPQPSHSPGRPHSTPLKGLEGRKQRTAQAELPTFSVCMLFFRPAL